jgi:hypothetical protein
LIKQERKKTSKSEFCSIFVKLHLVHFGCSYSESFIMARKLPNKEAEQQQLQAKNRYWLNELDSLGIDSKRKTELLNDEEELEKLTDIIKQAMFQDYKVAYSEEGDAYKEETHSTVTVG